MHEGGGSSVVDFIFFVNVGFKAW